MQSIEAPPLVVRIRPRCPSCREPATWMWRCFCYLDPLDCERAAGPFVGGIGWQPLWLCLECPGAPEVVA